MLGKRPKKIKEVKPKVEEIEEESEEEVENYEEAKVEDKSLLATDIIPVLPNILTPRPANVQLELKKHRDALMKEIQDEEDEESLA